MNVEIGAEAALFLEKEYISRIFVAVQRLRSLRLGNLTVIGLGAKSISNKPRIYCP
jgi:hypothetical protein